MERATKRESKNPTTFLSLPRELHQNVLLRTYNTNDLVRQSHSLDDDDDETKAWWLLFETHREWVKWWTRILDEVDKIAEDIEWVNEQWSRSHQKLLDDETTMSNGKVSRVRVAYDPCDIIKYLASSRPELKKELMVKLHFASREEESLTAELGWLKDSRSRPWMSCYSSVDDTWSAKRTLSDGLKDEKGSTSIVPIPRTQFMDKLELISFMPNCNLLCWSLSAQILIWWLQFLVLLWKINMNNQF